MYGEHPLGPRQGSPKLGENQYIAFFGMGCAHQYGQAISLYRRNVERLLSAKPKTALLVTLKIGITTALLAFVMSRTDTSSLRSLLFALPGGVLLTAVVLHFLAFALGAFRWWLLARAAGFGRSFMGACRGYFLGVFFNNFLPTGLGGDIVRIAHLRDPATSLTPLIASTISDRVIGLVAVFATGLCALSLLDQITLGNQSRATLFAAALIAVLSLWLFVTEWFGSRIDRCAAYTRHTRFRRGFIEILQSLHGLHRHRRLLFGALVISFAMQSLVVLTYYVLARALDLQQPLGLYFAVIPVVFVAAVLPVSIGGLGVREGALVNLLIFFGAGANQAVGLSVAYLGVLWVASLPGLLALLLFRNSHPNTAPAKSHGN